MTSEQLRRLAEACGVTTSYRNWRGQRVTVSEETIAAILDAMDGEPWAGTAAPPGLAIRYPPAPPAPERCWGFAVQLYSVRSRSSWGHGDLRDLAELATWSARELGAGFALINPLHAAEPAPPISPSPYLPMTRRFISPLYLRVEDIPEYARLGAADRKRIGDLAAPLQARSLTADLIDRDAIWSAKRTALELIHAQSRSAARQAALERFRVREGTALTDWATWCALAEILGPDFRQWPRSLRDSRSPAVAEERSRLANRVHFHEWLQWLADEQQAAAQAAARAAGMRIGIIGDLAVGAHPGGADAWAQSRVVARSVSVGAPPDEFNQRGQDWNQRPWHPGRLARTGFQPLHDLIRASLRHRGALRADHVMGLFRLWWIPEGMPPGGGTYVRYPHEAMVGVLTGEAARTGALAVGEDLGTVDPWIHEYLTAQGVLGTSMLWFERAADGSPLPPAQWRRACLATVGTHDVPPAAAFITGEQAELRARLGLLTHSQEAERKQAEEALAAWRDALAAEGLVAPGSWPDPARFTEALYAYLARTPSALIAVSLADAVGERRPQNLPGTTTEYPNWQVPLCDGEGQPVPLEGLPSHPEVRAVARAASGPH